MTRSLFYILITASTLTFVAPVLAQSCDEPCDSIGRFSRCCEHQKRRTVGSLFDWNGGVGSNALPQLDEPLVTDRPDFTEASSVVGLGVLQLESGYTYTFNDDPGERTIGQTYPETLIRYGVFANWLEFRLQYIYEDEDTNGQTAAGSNDLYLGFKIGLTPQNGMLPEMAIMPQMTVPSGSSDRTEGEVLAGLNWLYSWNINDFLSTGGSTQFNRRLDEVTDNGFTEWAQSWTIGYSLTEKLGAYTEYFGLYPDGADTTSPEHFFNAGFTLLQSNDVQWDIRGGTGLNDEADDYFFGAGLTIRFH